jgi:hypothetical protein
MARLKLSRVIFHLLCVLLISSVTSARDCTFDLKRIIGNEPLFLTRKSSMRFVFCVPDRGYIKVKDGSDLLLSCANSHSFKSFLT